PLYDSDMPSTDDPFHRDQPEDPPTLSANVTVPAALRAELEGVRQEHALAVAEAEHLRRQLVDRANTSRIFSGRSRR
ncbi:MULTISPECIES: hypothetical protein, partial [unclassified Streptomyces]|uniref:hypothetical protein n=1 Tax=unclassified Streptomyces TaxID=2593676 RepID=UPI0037F28499